jgi:beta-galactosidase
MDAGWRFALGDPQGAEQARFDDRQWRRLDVPHDWSIEGTPKEDAPGGGRIGFFPTGIGWYRKEFPRPSGSAGKRVWLEFDGIYMNSEVWVNGVSVGRRPFGYISFAYDITDRLKSGSNIIAVRVDNSKQPNSRWYTGSGIYRHVWLTVADPLHVGHWGVSITTPEADSSSASVMARTRIENDGREPRRGSLRAIVLDGSGREIARAETPYTVNAGEKTEVEQRMPVASPHLWSVETPHLYSLRTEVVLNNRVVDRVTTTFGIRTISYDKDQGFLLNGRRVKMRGVNLHHDGGAVGAAVPERIWETRLLALKAMGANAVRTSHNPPAPEFLDLCDRLGFLVMAEAFDEWTFGKVPEGYHNYFAEWSERDVVDFIHRDRNHPSIVLWSAGNETGEQGAPAGAGILRRLIDIFPREDPTRPVTTGNDNIAAEGHPATPDFLNTLDIVGYNYVDRWHERREIFAEEDRHDHPDWKMIGTESGTMFQSFDERYSLGDDPKVVRPNYNYGMMTAERLWKWITMRDYFAGNFMWTGVDYLGEATWPFKGFGSGVLDITGRPKDSYYLYQSLWNASAQSVLHLFPHWNWPGREGQVIPVLAYSNCNIVELFLNGRSLGEKRLEFPAQGTSGGWNSYAQPVVNSTTNDLHLSWDVPYEPGLLTAVGKRRDGTVACRDSVRTAGSPHAVRVFSDQDTVTAAPGDVALVRFEIVDSAGTVVPTADNQVQFAVTGGRILALDNGNLQDMEPYHSDRRKAFNGRGLAIIRADRAGVLRVSATATGLAPATLTLTVR